MKWLIACLLALMMVSAASAGEDPYIGIVGNDAYVLPPEVASFYFSPKHQQFLFDQEAWDIPVAGEGFASSTGVRDPEICDLSGLVPPRSNGKVAFNTEGWFAWAVRLPKRPSGQINIVIQCGVLKPEGEIFGVEFCAAETGERVAPNCSRQPVNPGNNPLIIGALPMVEAMAFHGPYNSFDPFHLTAYRNPGTYNGIPAAPAAMSNGPSLQVLDGTTGTRIVLKTCMDKTIVAKRPVTGQLNALQEEEHDLMDGDLIYVLLEIPRPNTVDIYCHAQSLKLAGIGESP